LGRGRYEMKMKLIGLFLFGAMMIANCNAPFGGSDSGFPQDDTPSQEENGVPLVPTLTPFGPHSQGSGSDPDSTDEVPEAQPSASPTPEDPWGEFTPPASQSAIDIPPPVPGLDVSEDMITFVLLGSDEAPHRYGHRTDTIVVVGLDKETDHAFLISIPRDLYVYVPGWRVDRINTADLFGGWDMVAETMLYNFGIEPDFWVRVNFTGFEGAVDLLGGIDVQVGRYLSDECGGTQWEYFPGTYNMDGFTALCYVRMRKTTSDFDRLRRQQEVMEAIFKRVLSVDGLSRIPQLYSEFNQHFESNAGLGDILPLIPLAADMASGTADVERFSVDQTLVTPWRVPSTGAAVLLPDREGIQELFKSLFES
jgi:LCP family protein required for cell wall assembly